MQSQTGPPEPALKRVVYSPDMTKRQRRPKARPAQGGHLLALRKAASLTQTELADAIGVPQTTIATWEWSDSPPRSDVLPALAKVLEVKVDELLAPTGKKSLAHRPGPVGEVQKAFEEVRKLPRNQQKKILETVFALVDRYKGERRVS